MKIQSENINMAVTDVLVEELVRHGIQQFYISPGSRSTPLTVAAARHTKTTCTVCVDERGAAFRALGYAKATAQPAVLICTSGTALANYMPAVVEAHMDFIPLIILSADRPHELIGTGANQTIYQKEFFGRYASYQETRCPDEHTNLKNILEIVDQSVAQTINGLVHINCPFKEPLEPTHTEFSLNIFEEIKNWLKDSEPFQKTFEKTSSSESDLQNILDTIQNTQNGLLTVGRLRFKHEKESVKKLAEKLNWPVWADVGSGLRFSSVCEPFFSNLADTDFFCDKKFDTILHLGGPFVSKKHQPYIATQNPQNYVIVNHHIYKETPRKPDSKNMLISVDSFCDDLVKKLDGKIHSKPDFPQIEHIINKITTDEKLTELSFTTTLTQNFPDDHILFLGNSLTVRHFDNFASQSEAILDICINRGASGIDGNIATAIGFADGHQKPVIAVVGDLTLLHDLNSLNMVQSCSQPVIIIVINNNGGGIFNFLPIANHTDVLKEYFNIPQNITFKKAAEMFALDYANPINRTVFINSLSNFVNNEKNVLIEIITDKTETQTLYQEIKNELDLIL